MLVFAFAQPLRYAIPVRFICLAGVCDSFYLLLNSLDPSIGVICPSGGVIDCATVTTSIYSHVVGIPLPLFGLCLFSLFAALTFLDHPDAMLFMYVFALVSVSYLVGVELFVLHAICLYCTFAHVLGLLNGIPLYLSIRSEPGKVWIH